MHYRLTGQEEGGHREESHDPQEGEFPSPVVKPTQDPGPRHGTGGNRGEAEEQKRPAHEYERQRHHSGRSRLWLEERLRRQRRASNCRGLGLTRGAGTLSPQSGSASTGFRPGMGGLGALNAQTRGACLRLGREPRGRSLIHARSLGNRRRRLRRCRSRRRRGLLRRWRWWWFRWRFRFQPRKCGACRQAESDREQVNQDLAKRFHWPQ
jgi:hypothetical protein